MTVADQLEHCNKPMAAAHVPDQRVPRCISRNRLNMAAPNSRERDIRPSLS